jgi:hypothetical protein
LVDLLQQLFLALELRVDLGSSASPRATCFSSSSSISASRCLAGALLTARTRRRRLPSSSAATAASAAAARMEQHPGDGARRASRQRPRRTVERSNGAPITDHHAFPRALGEASRWDHC